MFARPRFRRNQRTIGERLATHDLGGGFQTPSFSAQVSNSSPVVFREFDHKFGLTLYKNSTKSGEWFKHNFPLIAKPWKELCNEYLPNPEHAKLRERLLLLGDIHGPAMRKRFPPEDGSVAAEEEKARRLSVSRLPLGNVTSLIAQLVMTIST